jgi:tRNA (guanine37-N1)-methyltransferase
MKFHVITIFPGLLDSYLSDSILARAIASKKISVRMYDPRENSKNKHHKVDDRPYGGGPGMVMSALPILRTVQKIQKNLARRKIKVVQKTVIFSPGGELFTNVQAQKYSKRYTDIIMICGRYEGIDDRVRKALRATELSIGEFVLTGGELPALVLVDAITRQIPGVLGKYESLEEQRTASHRMYTRPEVLPWEGKNYKVPKVLMSGDHKKIEEWRRGEL